MLENAPASDDFTQLFCELLTVWDDTNRRLLAFDGAGFARHVAEEARLCAKLEDALGRSACAGRAERWVEMGHAVRRRKALLASTQRTVCALRGVYAVSFPTYEAALTRDY